MQTKLNDFIPALRFKWLTNLYDYFMKFTLPENYLKTLLIKTANLNNQQKILDLGCGTATLTIMIKQQFPDSEITGTDIDSLVLEISRNKIKQLGLNIKLDQANSTLLYYENDSFERVMCSLVIHHLTRSQKIQTINEVFRILKPGGEFHILDFSKPHNKFMFLISLIMRNFEQTKENIHGLLPEFLKKSGFSQITIENNFSTVFGTMAIIKAKKS